jgi:hypothetical protein
MRLTHRRVAVIGGLACSAMLFTGTTTTAQAASSSSLAGDSRLSGPAVTISVAIPAGWHQLADQSHPEMLQMVYPDSCSQGPQCATGIARLASGQATSAHEAASGAEQTVATLPGVQAASITSEGPVQIAGHSGYQVHFAYTHANTKFQATTAAVETGPAASGKVPTSLIFVQVSDRAEAPPATVIDQIIGSAQLVNQQN